MVTQEARGSKHCETCSSRYSLVGCHQYRDNLQRAEYVNIIPNDTSYPAIIQFNNQFAESRSELKDVLDNSEPTEEWRFADVMRVKFRLHIVLKARGQLDEADEVLAEMESFAWRGNVPEGKQWTDKVDMELLDGDILTLDYGRTAGIWSNGEFW